jgi:tetratricopeptide (TPR) repeat protein
MGRRIGPAVAAALILTAIGVTVTWAGARWAADPLAEGRAAYERRDYRRASTLARDRLKAEPENSEAVRLLARATAREGRDKMALDLFQRLDSGRYQAEDFFLIAVGLERAARRRDLARGALERALERDPDHPDSLFVLAQFDAANDDLYAAADRAGQLARIAGWEGRGSVLLGSYLRDLSDPAGAAEALDRGLRLDPVLKGATLSPEEARLALVRCRLCSGRPDLARAALKGMPGDDPTASWLLGRALLQEGRVSEAAAALARAGPGGRGEMTAPEPAPFIGADRCAGCHREIASAQRSSRHARTLTPPERARDVTLPDHPTADPQDPTVTHTFRRDGDGAAVETRRGDDSARAIIAFALGSGRRAQTSIGRDDTGQFRQLRLTRYSGSIWDKTTGLDPQPRPGDAHGYLGQPLSRDGLRQCLSCHATDFRAARDRDGPVATDPSIGCERCHGAGANHLQAVAGKFRDPAIARPKLAPGEEVTRLCAGCHSPRVHRISPDDPAAPRFQGTTMTWSRCYTESGGRLSCLTCHDPHRDSETSAAFYEARCLGCHSSQPPPVPPSASRTRPATLPEGVKPVPCPVEPSRDCVRCHMPAVEAAVPHVTYTDHYIRKRTGETLGGY